MKPFTLSELRVILKKSPTLQDFLQNFAEFATEKYLRENGEYPDPKKIVELVKGVSESKAVRRLYE